MDPEKEKELLEKIDSKESLKMCLNSDELIEGTTKIRKEILESEEFIANLEHPRREENKI